jgi:iron(II)-dependent oxidoreductase
VTNASFLSFAEGGGYEYRPWWSEEGWSWKQCYDITHPGGWAGGPPRDLGAPVQHVSWFEADAFARSQGARLPFEAHPYREYSEVFFGKGYKVLRGGSWAASPLVVSKTFRNWDLPERCQIFSGVRLARD